MRAAGQPQGLCAVTRLRCFVPLVGEQRHQVFAVDGVVVDDQYLLHDYDRAAGASERNDGARKLSTSDTKVSGVIGFVM